MKLTHEEKQAIYEAYIGGDTKVTDIAKKYNILRGAVTRIAVEMGATPKNSSYGRKRGKNKAKVCPKCRKTIEVVGAKFCCYCGSDIRSDREILVSRIENAMKHIKYLPDSVRDETQKLYLDVIKELSV